MIKRLLDSGAQSLLIPFVQNAEEAQLAVSGHTLSPLRHSRCHQYRTGSALWTSQNYLHEASDEIAVIVQIETGDALNQIEAIASVDGVDAVFIGPSDLSASLGHLGNAKHSDVQSALKTAIDKLQSLGKPAGILAFNPMNAKRYIEWGYQFIAVGADLTLLAKGLMHSPNTSHHVKTIEYDPIRRGYIMASQNLLFIISDQHQQQALGCYGQSNCTNPESRPLSGIRNSLYQCLYTVCDLCSCTGILSDRAIRASNRVLG